MKVYDVFGMIPPPGEHDGADVHERYAKIAAGDARGVGGETYYGYRDDLYERGDRVVRPARRAGRGAQRRADPRPVRGHDRARRPGRVRAPRRRLVRVDDDVPASGSRRCSRRAGGSCSTTTTSGPAAAPPSTSTSPAATSSGSSTARSCTSSVLRARRERRAREQWAREAPREHVRAGLARAPAETLARDPRARRRRPARRAGRELVRDPRRGLRLRRPGARARRSSPSSTAASATARRCALERDSLRAWVAADADSPTAPSPAGGRRTLAVMDYGHPGVHRASANIGDHIQSIAALGHLVRHRGVRLHGEAPLVELLGTLGGARPPRAPARRDRRRPRGHHRPPRRLDVPADPARHLGPVLRLVHARAVRDAPRLPAAPQPAPDLRLVPLQQARAADAGGDRVPAAPRAGRLPRLDDGLPAAVVRRAGVLLRLRHDDDRHGLPGRARRPPDAPVAYVDVPGRAALRAQRPRGPAAAVRCQRARRARPARDLPHARTAPSSPRACTATCRCARSACRSSSGRATAPTSASTA